MSNLLASNGKFTSPKGNKPLNLSNSRKKFQPKLDSEYDDEFVDSPSKKTTMRKKFLNEIDVSRISAKHSQFTPSHTSQKNATSSHYYEQCKHLIENENVNKSTKQLEEENNILRDHLKYINHELTKVVEGAKTTSTFIPKRYTEFKEKPEEEKIKTIEKEIENNKKIMELALVEYKNVKIRLEEIKDPLYSIRLEEEIEKTEHQAESIKRKNIKASISNHLSAKNLQSIETEGMSSVDKEINDKGKEIILSRKKLEKIQGQNQAYAEEKSRKLQGITELNGQYEKLMQMAQQYNVYEDTSLIDKYAKLEKQYKVYDESYKNYITRNEKFVMGKHRKECKETESDILRNRDHLSKLEEMIQQQKSDLRDMIERQGISQDKSTLEVLTHMRNAMEPGGKRQPGESNRGSPGAINLYSSKNDSQRSIRSKKDIIYDGQSRRSSNAKHHSRSPSGSQSPQIESRDRSQEVGYQQSEPSAKDQHHDVIREPTPQHNEVEQYGEPSKQESSVEQIKQEEKKVEEPIKQEEPEELQPQQDDADFEPQGQESEQKEKSVEKEPEDLNLPGTDDKKSNEDNVDVEDLQLPEKKKDESDEQEKADSKPKEELVLGDEFKPIQKDFKEDENDQSEFKGKEQKEIKDPFSNFDNVDPDEIAKNSDAKIEPLPKEDKLDQMFNDSAKKEDDKDNQGVIDNKKPFGNDDGEDPKKDYAKEAEEKGGGGFFDGFDED